MRKRLDTRMAELGLFESRSRAAAAVMAGEVKVGGQPARKPGQMVSEDDRIEGERGPDYVSRGGIKLVNALDALGIDVAGRHALDVGASTGGFTHSLLHSGAAPVVPLELGL